MECKIKLLISDLKTCSGLGSGYKKDHHAVERGVKMRDMRVLSFSKIAWQDCVHVQCYRMCAHTGIKIIYMSSPCKVEKVKKEE